MPMIVLSGLQRLQAMSMMIAAQHVVNDAIAGINGMF
ncbi:unnamed protein product [Arabidopsis thaliana]|uniref:(thale cress) hypothetical protein n=1 Tax=Arabidopsis thaliana TaxID=3702 RepID=A0A7G2EKG7_ARATH|nr:unnamed protein product [Arabidopsis thaliana]